MSRAEPMPSGRRITAYLRGRADFTPRQLRREYHKWRRGLSGQRAHMLDYSSRSHDGKGRPTPRQRKREAAQ